MDHHDDWAHWPPEESGSHGGDAPGSDDLGHDDLGHDDLGHDDLRHGPGGPDDGGHPGYDGDPFGAEHLTGMSDHDPFGAPGDAAADHDLADVPDLRHDADSGDPAGHGTEPLTSTVDGPGPAEAAVDPHVVGVDYDLPPGDAPDPEFPPPLDLPDRPEPVDGYPWSDPATLGDIGTVTGAPLVIDGAPPVDDLLSYAGMDPPGPGVDPWAAMADSDDPAVSALARWWGPAT